VRDDEGESGRSRYASDAGPSRGAIENITCAEYARDVLLVKV